MPPHKEVRAKFFAQANKFEKCTPPHKEVRANFLRKQINLKLLENHAFQGAYSDNPRTELFRIMRHASAQGSAGQIFCASK